MQSKLNMDDLFQLIFVSLLIGSAQGACDRSDGPSGSTACVLLTPYYNKYQWATCLTDTYIKVFSEGNHMCRDSLTKYCWYQVMAIGYVKIWMKFLETRPVYDNCTCGPDAPKKVTTQRPVVTSAIPDWCFSPSGSDCSWYKECLEARYPCKEQGDSYALDYAGKFCNLYQDHYQEFNTIGQEWIDAVRKCLQVKLVPILRPFVVATCESIKQTAFDSHSGCYLHPDSGKPSICDIGVGNWARIFWTVKGALIQDATETLKQMLDVVSACGTDILSLGMENIQMIFRREKEMVLRNLNKFAENIADQMASKMKWNTRGISFFGYPTLITPNRNKRAADINTNTFYINILIAAKSVFDLNAVDSPRANLSAEAISVATSIENGDVRLDIAQGIEFKELSLCIDYNCTDTSLQVEPAPPKKNGVSASNVKPFTIVLTIIAAMAASVLALHLKMLRHCLLS
ncbi:uncharacterized protein LOC132755268 [Ruditapes philippinarum]|uniref:uncharacterized protein LOC132755268 n=1 Tax=Ruditapes philippinarum TaxID=129788 RepID=UPI00295B0EC4|nr:uncharacterized protein LOC132755268 [Ruditapes philippinarum]